ncbi:MAG TPA: hypothetical protein ENK23_06770, partial [Sorangium sp.]|nr:hypothetical protein [Sorangium sp.]
SSVGPVQQFLQPHHHHPSDEARQQRFYAAQVIWDESMARVSSIWLQQHPRGRLLVLAGNGHCHHSAIVGRVKRRLPQQHQRILSVLLAPANAPLPPFTSSDLVIKVPRAQAR